MNLAFTIQYGQGSSSTAAPGNDRPQELFINLVAPASRPLAQRASIDRL